MMVVSEHVDSVCAGHLCSAVQVSILSDVAKMQKYEVPHSPIRLSTLSFAHVVTIFLIFGEISSLTHSMLANECVCEPVRSLMPSSMCMLSPVDTGI